MLRIFRKRLHDCESNSCCNDFCFAEENTFGDNFAFYLSADLECLRILFIAGDNLQLLPERSEKRIPLNTLLHRQKCV